MISEIFSPSSITYLILTFVFVGLNAFFVAAEFAIVKVRETRLEILVNKGHHRAKMAQKIVHKLDPYLSATQLGITLASLGLGWIGEPLFSGLMTPILKLISPTLSTATIQSISITVGFLTISMLHIILGELVPKSIAIQTAEKVSMAVAYPLHIFYMVFYPFLWAMNSLSNAILKMLKLPPASGPSRAPSEAELKLIVEDSFEEGTIGSGKRVLLDKALDFSNTTLKDIMVPKDQMVCFDLSDTVHDNLERARNSGHTRFPLRLSPDGDTIGFVHMKDIIWSLEHGDVINLYDLRRALLFFSCDTKIDEALKEFQKMKIHMAAVCDADKNILGLITLEDVIEELVGEIEDEFDRRAHAGG